jgi:hypothetical protein
MRFVGHVASIEKNVSSFNIFVRKPEAERSFVSTARQKCQDNLEPTDTEQEGVECIHLTHDTS